MINAKVKDLMSTELTTLGPTMTLAEARDLLIKNRVSGAPVVSEDGELLGVFSQSDFVRAFSTAEIGAAQYDDFFMDLMTWDEAMIFGNVKGRLESKLVIDSMGENLFTVSPEDEVAYVARTMRQYKIHRVIVTKNAKVVGIVTTLDLLKLLENY